MMAATPLGLLTVTAAISAHTGGWAKVANCLNVFGVCLHNVKLSAISLSL